MLKRPLEETALPGNGHLYGNFSNYYSFHPPVSRLSLFKPGLFYSIWIAQGRPNSFIMLDIGCNEGDLSVGLLKRAIEEIPEAHVHLLGMDIDSELVNKATAKHSDLSKHCHFLCADAMTDAAHDLLRTHLQTHHVSVFHFLSLFSVTMWLHVHHGSSALFDFLGKMSLISSALLVEPQPWRCYRAAKKRCTKNAIDLPPYMRPEKGSQQLSSTNIDQDIVSSVIASGLKSEQYLCLGREEWGRALLLFVDNQHDLVHLIDEGGA